MINTSKYKIAKMVRTITNDNITWASTECIIQNHWHALTCNRIHWMHVNRTHAHTLKFDWHALQWFEIQVQCIEVNGHARGPRWHSFALQPNANGMQAGTCRGVPFKSLTCNCKSLTCNWHALTCIETRLKFIECICNSLTCFCYSLTCSLNEFGCIVMQATCDWQALKYKW